MSRLPADVHSTSFEVLEGKMDKLNEIRDWSGGLHTALLHDTPTHWSVLSVCRNPSSGIASILGGDLVQSCCRLN